MFGSGTNNSTGTDCQSQHYYQWEDSPTPYHKGIPAEWISWSVPRHWRPTRGKLPHSYRKRLSTNSAPTAARGSQPEVSIQIRAREGHSTGLTLHRPSVEVWWFPAAVSWPEWPQQKYLWNTMLYQTNWLHSTRVIKIKILHPSGCQIWVLARVLGQRNNVLRTFNIPWGWDILLVLGCQSTDIEHEAAMFQLLRLPARANRSPLMRRHLSSGPRL